MLEEDKNKITISDISGDVVVSKDQTGGITAHTVNLNTFKIPEPTFTIKKISNNVISQNGYQSEFIFNIKTNTPLSNLCIQANGNNIIKMDIIPQHNGGTLFGHSGIRDSFAFNNVKGAYGDYKIIVVTKEKQEIKFDFSYE